jgi:hypothetical protein
MKIFGMNSIGNHRSRFNVCISCALNNTNDIR